MLKKYFLLISFFVSFFVCAQVDIRKKIDSLIVIVSRSDAFEKLGEKDILRMTTEIYYQSKEINYKEGQMNALSYRSNVYYNTGKISQAMYDLEEGIHIAEKLGDYYELARLIFGKAFCYTKLGLFDESSMSLREGFNYAAKIKDQNKYHLVRLSLYNGMMWNAYLSKSNDRNTILKYACNAYKEAGLLNPKFPESYGWQVQSASNYATGILLLGNNVKYAEKLINEAEKISGKIIDSRHLTALFQAKGILENKKKNYSRSVESFQEAIRVAQKGRMVYELPWVYRELSKSYEGAGDLKNASLYLSKSKNLSDSLVVVEKKAAEGYFRERAGEKTTSFYYYAFIISVIIALVFLLYILKKKTGRVSLPDPEISKQIPVHDKDPEPENYTRLTQLVKNNDPAFYMHFKNAFPEFIQTLLSVDPQLKVSDLEYCALITLNFDTKQIAKFKNSSVKAVENKKYRLKKKLRISTDENLYSWMINKNNKNTC